MQQKSKVRSRAIRSNKDKFTCSNALSVHFTNTGDNPVKIFGESSSQLIELATNETFEVKGHPLAPLNQLFTFDFGATQSIISIFETYIIQD